MHPPHLHSLEAPRCLQEFRLPTAVAVRPTGSRHSAELIEDNARGEPLRDEVILITFYKL
jgi:hypothetical protein